MVYLSIFHIVSRTHIALRRDSAGDFDYCPPEGQPDGRQLYEGSRTGEDSNTPSRSAARCHGMQPNGVRTAPTIQPDLRRVRIEAEENLKQLRPGGASVAAHPMLMSPRGPRSPRGGSMSRTLPGGGAGGFAGLLAQESQEHRYFGNWIIKLDAEDGGSFDAIEIRHIEHERSAFRLGASVVGSASFVDTREPPVTHMLAPPPAWGLAATNRSNTAWVSDWSTGAVNHSLAVTV